MVEGPVERDGAAVVVHHEMDRVVREHLRQPRTEAAGVILGAVARCGGAVRETEAEVIGSDDAAPG